MILDSAGPRNTGAGLAVIRVVTGLTFAAHGYQKFFIMGIDATTGFFEQVGVPLAGIAAILIATLEVAGGIALMLGLFTRYVAIPLALDVAGAIFFVHAKNGFFVQNGGIELVLLLLAGAIGLALAGPGSWALDNRRKR